MKNKKKMMTEIKNNSENNGPINNNNGKKLYHIKKKIEDLFLNSFITQFVDYYLYNYKS